MRIIFMGTPSFAVPALTALIDNDYNIVSVYTRYPKPASRGMSIVKSEIHQFAESKNLNVHTPKTLKSDNEINYLKSLNPDILVVAAYGMILPKQILQIPKYGVINIHPSLLPRWRGAAPIQRAVLNGDTETGCCIMQMDEGLDTGEIILQQKIPLPIESTSSEMHDILSQLGANLLIEAMQQINQNKYNKIPQSENGVLYANKISAIEEKLDFTNEAFFIYNQIRGLANYPCAYFIFDNQKFKILKAEFELSEHNFKLGEITNDKFHIACKNGFIKPMVIQKQGKKPMQIKDFLNGNKIAVGTILN